MEEATHERAKSDQGARVEAEGLAEKFLRAAEQKAAVVSAVIHDPYGPGVSGIADDFGVSIELALKARFIYHELGDWDETADVESMIEGVKEEIGHRVRGVLQKLPIRDRNRLESLYTESVRAHQRADRVFYGNNTGKASQRKNERRRWVRFEQFIGWIEKAVFERYEASEPEIALPVGRRGVESFAATVIEWANEPLARVSAKRSLRDEIGRAVDKNAAGTMKRGNQRRKPTRKRLNNMRYEIAVLQAQCFLSAAHRIEQEWRTLTSGEETHEPGENSDPITALEGMVVTPVLRALGAELALKALDIVTTGYYTKTHDLIELFDGLPAKALERISQAQRYPGGEPGHRFVRRVLENHKKDFERGRYLGQEMPSEAHRSLALTEDLAVAAKAIIVACR